MLHCSACLCILLKEQQGDPRRVGNTAAVGWGAEVSWCGRIALWICSTNIDIGWKRILLSLVSILTIPATYTGSWPWISERLGWCSVPREWQCLTPPWASCSSDLQVIWHNSLRLFDAVQTRLENSHWTAEGLCKACMLWAQPCWSQGKFCAWWGGWALMRLWVETLHSCLTKTRALSSLCCMCQLT